VILFINIIFDFIVYQLKNQLYKLFSFEIFFIFLFS